MTVSSHEFQSFSDDPSARGPSFVVLSDEDQRKSVKIGRF